MCGSECFSVSAAPEPTKPKRPRELEAEGLYSSFFASSQSLLALILAVPAVPEKRKKHKIAEDEEVKEVKPKELEV
jgi:hypothetical protein